MEDWRIAIGLRWDDPPDLRDHLMAYYPAEHHGEASWIDESGQPVRLLYMDVAAANPDSAAEEAGRIYTLARERAGLATPTVRWLGYTRLDDVEPLDTRLMIRANRRESEGHYAEAVVLAQTACEVRARETLVGLLRKAGMERLEFVVPRAPTFRDRTSSALLVALTSIQIGDEEWWSEYLDHCDRRNGIVHNGLSVNQAGAEASIAVAKELLGLLLPWQLSARSDGRSSASGSPTPSSSK